MTAEPPPDRGRRWLADQARAMAGPLIGAAVLTGLLSAWVATSGAGTLTRVRLEVTLAAVPMRAFTPKAADAIHQAGTYLTITNLSGTPDQLIAVRSPLAEKIAFTVRDGLSGPGKAVSALAVPGHGTLTLSPLTDDVVLDNPARFEDRGTVPLTLVFREAGRITIDAPVTAPGTP